jgi:hypothetical protein
VSRSRLARLSNALLTLLLVTCAVSAGGQAVKKSKSGICHSSESSYYERTKTYKAFESVPACLAAGGRLPKDMDSNAPSNTSALAEAGYSRDRFGSGWADVDGDCQNSRAEALIEQSTTQVRFADERRCRVVTGRWISPFTGKVIQNASDIDIDHVVPLKWAWDHGASKWPMNKRERFANDRVNLWSVELGLNRQKGAKGPEEWLPPAGKCGYVSRFVRIVKVYSLEPSDLQLQRYKQQLADYCG